MLYCGYTRTIGDNVGNYLGFYSTFFGLGGDGV